MNIGLISDESKMESVMIRSQVVRSVAQRSCLEIPGRLRASRHSSLLRWSSRYPVECQHPRTKWKRDSKRDIFKTFKKTSKWRSYLSYTVYILYICNLFEADSPLQPMTSTRTPRSNSWISPAVALWWVFSLRCPTCTWAKAPPSALSSLRVTSCAPTRWASTSDAACVRCRSEICSGRTCRRRSYDTSREAWGPL